MKKSSKIVKINNSNIKKLKMLAVVFIILFILIIFRLVYLQFIDGPSLSKAASTQQTATKTLTPSRGTIYDSNGKVLALSAEVDTVSVNPSKLKDSKGNEVNKDFVANSFSNIFGIDSSEIYSA